MTAAAMSERIVTAPVDADPDDVAHFVMVPAGEPDATPQAYVLRARIEQLPVVAICGHVFVPVKSPTDLLPCSRCVEVYQQPGEHRDERDDLPEA